MRVLRRKTIKKTTKSTTSLTSMKPSSSSTSSTSNSSNTNTSYNDILNKLNDYVLKSSITNFVTNETLATAISNIKQCNCEPSTNTTPTQTIDNTALNDLIRKLNNYGYFPYDVQGKETIVTEFFPHLTANSSGTYSDGTMPYCFDSNWQILMTLAQSNESTVNDLDFVYIQTSNGYKTINSLSLAKYFIKYSEKGSYNYIVSKDILNEPVTITNNKGIKSIKIIWSWSELQAAANYTSTNVDDPINFNGPTEMFVEFMPATNYTKNGITCTFDAAGISGTGHYIAGGTIKLTLPENISLVNNIPNGSYTISANGNIITIKLAEEDANGNVIQYYGVFTKQIIIADSSTKRYVIKLNGEASALPPNY